MSYLLTSSSSGRSAPLEVVAFFVVNSLLYPYSRFVYEGIIGFKLGGNVLIAKIPIVLTLKFITMMEKAHPRLVQVNKRIKGFAPLADPR